jgi:hypothetical protein
MAVGTLYALHGIVNSSTFISQIDSARPSPNTDFQDGIPSGFPYRLFTGVFAQNPGISFESPQVKTLLDLTGALTSIVDLSGGNTDLYFKKIADLGRRVADATAEHIRFRMAQAFLSVNQISAGDRQRAVASCYLGTTYNGSTDPLVPAGSLALAGTPTAAEHFVAGPVTLNTVALPGVQDITIDFGRQLLEVSGDGELWNTFAACQQYNPVITVRCATHAWQTYGLAGTVLTSGDFYLRKCNAMGRVANATEEHIKFSATTGLITVTESGGGGNEPSITTYRIDLVGTNATTEPITLDTTAAIT